MKHTTTPPDSKPVPFPVSVDGLSPEATALRDAAVDLGLTVRASFVPWSRSRGHAGWIAGETRRDAYRNDGKPRKLTPDEIAKGPRATDRSLNWIVTIARDGRDILSADYAAGIGHCPCYAKHHGPMTTDDARSIEHETEKGTTAMRNGPGGQYGGNAKPILPDPIAVLAAFLSDAGAIDAATFEDWASDYGYDTDSRYAEATYRTCLEVGLKLRAALGETGLAALRTAAEGY